MSSSRRRHHQSSGSGPLKGSGRDEKHYRSPIAGGNPPRTSGSVSRPQQPLGSDVFLDRTQAQPNPFILPSANFQDGTTFATAYTAPEDIKMAEQQKNYLSLPPAEQQAQDQWALQKIMQYEYACPNGYAWNRHYQAGYEGYRCQGGQHLITHKLLAEGQGGLYMVKRAGDPRGMGNLPGSAEIEGPTPPWAGPIYLGPDGRRYNAAYPGGPSIMMADWMGFGQQRGYRASMQDRGSRGGYGGRQDSSVLVGGGGTRGSILPSAKFRDNPTAGWSRPAPDQPSTPKVKEYPRNIPVDYIPSYGGRSAPKGYKPEHPRLGETDWTIHPKPRYDRSKDTTNFMAEAAKNQANTPNPTHIRNHIQEPWPKISSATPLSTVPSAPPKINGQSLNSANPVPAE